jgi:hypothetical protein
MRWSPATPALACISALYQPLKRANYSALMSVNTGTVRDGSSAQKSAVWRSNRRANPPHGIDGWGSWPGVRARTFLPETKQRVQKRKQACRSRMTAHVFCLKVLVSRIPQDAGSFERS